MIIHSRKPHEVIGSVLAVIAKTSLPACPKNFKLLVAYLEGLRAVAPYRRGTDEPRATVQRGGCWQGVRQAQRGQEIGAHGLLEAQAWEWYCGAPKGLRPAAARREDNDVSAASEQSAVAAAAQEADGASR
jgi:hypothetical protein